MSRTTVFYDGSCPLCTREIGSCRRKDVDRALSFVDVRDPCAALPEGLDRAWLMARFHAMTPDGRLLSGAGGFVAIWERLAGWRVLARLARLAGAVPALEGLYRVFLRLRLLVVRMFRAADRVARRGGYRAAGAPAPRGMAAAPRGAGTAENDQDTLTGPNRTSPAPGARARAITSRPEGAAACGGCGKMMRRVP